MKVLITGATGLIGQQLGIELTRAGHHLVVISRDIKKAQLELPFPCEIIQGDLMRSQLELPSDLDAVIHLLGEGVANKRWSAQHKEQILKSRTASSQNLIDSFKVMPRLWIQASAVGYYGDQGDLELSEDSPAGNDFLAKVCQEWEKFAELALAKGATREVRARLGVVLSPKGGAIEKMRTAFEVGVGGALGSGKQWMSWIHVQDVVRLFRESLEDSRYSGPINFTSPDAKTNGQFSKILSGHFGRLLGPRVPQAALDILLGEMSQVLVSSQKVIPKKALQIGFQFKFPNLQEALNSVLPGAGLGEQFFEAYQYLPVPRERVFVFFSQAENLEKITPQFLNFKITHTSTVGVQPGTEIDYKLKVHGLPLRWKTRIEDFQAPNYFIDTALKSPYQKWHHTHVFEDLGPGTLMIDRVLYKLPLGYLGWLFGHPLVKKDVNEIFSYRRQAVLELLK